jgi:hypothetical protein
MHSRARFRFSGLWHHPDFLKFWAGQTVSMVGTRVTVLALPLTAILTLHASPIQIGVLGAVRSAASFLFGMVAGVWVDRSTRSTSEASSKPSRRRACGGG